MSEHLREARYVLQDVSLPAQHHPVDDRSGSTSFALPGEWQVIHAEGELDLECVPRLRSLLTTAGPRVVLDLRLVTFMDASGLGVLAAASERARSLGGAVRLVGACHEVRRIVEVTRLDGVLSMFDSLLEALVGTPA